MPVKLEWDYINNPYKIGTICHDHLFKGFKV